MTLRDEIDTALQEKGDSQHLIVKGYQAVMAQRRNVAQDILESWEAHKPFVRLAGLRRDVFKTEAGLRPRLLSDLERRASIQAQAYREIVSNTRQLWADIMKTHPVALASKHSLFESYQALKAERNALAYGIEENPSLYRPFLFVKRSQGKLQDFWGQEIDPKDRFLTQSLKQHAAEHQRCQLEASFEEKLELKERETYVKVKLYREMEGQVGCLFRLLKSGKETALFPQEQLSSVRWEIVQVRDSLALQIVTEKDACETFFKRLQISPDKLFQHATFGEVRETAHQYHACQDLRKKSSSIWHSRKDRCHPPRS
jgi:hypothetical protein